MALFHPYSIVYGVCDITHSFPMSVLMVPHWAMLYSRLLVCFSVEAQRGIEPLTLNPRASSLPLSYRASVETGIPPAS